MMTDSSMKIDEGGLGHKRKIVTQDQYTTLYSIVNNYKINIQYVCMKKASIRNPDHPNAIKQRRQLKPKAAPDQHRLSEAKLFFLGLVLVLVWILCKKSEQKIPSIVNRSVLQRLEDRNISDEKISQTINNYYKKNFWQKIPFNAKGDDIQANLCIFLNYKSFHQSWASTVDSLIQQNYGRFRIFYFNVPTKVATTLQSHFQLYPSQKAKIDLQSFQQLQNSSYVALFEGVKQKCKDFEYAVIVEGDWILPNEKILKLLQSKIYEDRQNSVDVVYGGTLIIDGQDTVRLGQSFPYPEKILEQKDFFDYPYVIDGIIVLKMQKVKDIEYKYLKGKQKIEKILKAGIILEVFQQSQRIKYIPDILTMMEKEDSLITDSKGKEQFESLRQIKRQKVNSS